MMHPASVFAFMECQSRSFKRKRALWEFLSRGYAAILTCIEEARTNPTWLGAPLTEELIQAFEQSGIDPCGERGEYHTFVYAGPLFSFPLAFCLGERLSLPGFQLIDIQPQSDMH